jgi:hypothetical protein
MENCLNRWVEDRHLNTYGDGPDTVYPGGTPLFDERTGKSRDRADYIFSRHLDAKAACANAK